MKAALSKLEGHPLLMIDVSNVIACITILPICRLAFKCLFMAEKSMCNGVHAIIFPLALFMISMIATHIRNSGLFLSFRIYTRWIIGSAVRSIIEMSTCHRYGVVLSDLDLTQRWVVCMNRMDNAIDVLFDHFVDCDPGSRLVSIARCSWITCHD